MASYLVMKPPGPDPRPESVRFVRDGFSWAALVFPLVWMLFHRMWLYALLLVIVSGLIGALAEASGFETAGTIAVCALNLLIALESGEIRRLHLTSKGWSLERILSAGSLAEAEIIYFSNVDLPAPAPVPSPAALPAGSPRRASAPALGLFDPYEGR